MQQVPRFNRSAFQNAEHAPLPDIQHDTPRPRRNPATDAFTPSHQFQHIPLTDAQLAHYAKTCPDRRAREIPADWMMQDSRHIAAFDDNNPDRGGISYFLLARAATKLRDAYVIVWEYFAQRFTGGTKDVWRTARADLILFIMCFEQGRRWFFVAITHGVPGTTSTKPHFSVMLGSLAT